ncbi:MAG TPA: SPFH domain-containing protein [Ramlibacter sp.]|nr:SPFH domain-containing protein [Ramlibacter sp.]
MGACGLARVPQNTTGVVTTFGRVSGMREPGLTGYVPFVQKVVVVSNRQVESEFSVFSVTSDNANVQLRVALQYRVAPAQSAHALYSLDVPEKQMYSFVNNVVRLKVPHMTLEDLYRTEQLNEHLESALAAQVGRHGIEIINAQVQDIQPSKEIVAAMDSVVAADRRLKAARMEAEAEAVKKIKAAEADAVRKRLQGEGTAAQREAIMHGWAESVGQMAEKHGVRPEHIMEFVLRMQALEVQLAAATGASSKVIFPPPVNTSMTALMQALEAKN